MCVCACVHACISSKGSIKSFVCCQRLHSAHPLSLPCPYNQDEDDDAGDPDAYYVDKEIIEQQLQTKTYQMSREEAKT